MDILELNNKINGTVPAKSNKTSQKQAAKMKMSKVGNQTNSQDPQAVNSRVFVGNLNTFQCSKTDVERMFQRYGRLAGISMHKGYAFVQFTNPFDARSACLGEDGRTVLSQILDVNMVAEPKPHQTGRKRQNVAKTGNDWDYYYDSYYASTAFPVGPPRLVPPLKRQRLMTSTVRNKTNQSTKANLTPPLDQLKVYSNPDILICGNCREMFTDLHDLVDHKKTYCKLRFTCKCDTFNKSKSTPDDNSTASLLCVQCKDAFQNAWDLMVHAQAAHMLNIYELGVSSIGNCSSPPMSPRDNNTPDKRNRRHHKSKISSGNSTGTEHSPSGSRHISAMSDPNITESDSDVDSNSSWTLLTDERQPCNKEEGGQNKLDESIEVLNREVDDGKAKDIKNQHGDQIENVNSLWPNDMDVESISSSSSIESIHPVSQPEENKAPVLGCITYQEYIKEQELLKEYEFDEQASHWEQQLEKTKPRKKKYKKIRTDQVSTAKVVGAVLSLAGISFVCMMAPYLTRQFVTSDLENKLEKNFTKVDSQYAKSHGYEVYIDNSEEAKAVSRKPEALEALARQCCLTHINSRGKVIRKCSRCSREQPSLQKFLRDASKELKKEKGSLTALVTEVKSKESNNCVKDERPRILSEDKVMHIKNNEKYAMEETLKNTKKENPLNNTPTKKIDISNDDNNSLEKDKAIKTIEKISIIDLTKDDDDDFPEEKPSAKEIIEKRSIDKVEKQKKIDKKVTEKKNIIQKDSKKKLSKKVEEAKLTKKETNKSPDSLKELAKKIDTGLKRKEVSPKAVKAELKVSSKKEPKKVTQKPEVAKKMKSSVKPTKIDGTKVKAEPSGKISKTPSKIDNTKKPAKSTLGFSKLNLMEIQPDPSATSKSDPVGEGTFKSQLHSYSKFENKQQDADRAMSEKEDGPKSKDESPPMPKFAQFRCDYMACQLLQDIALLRITGKLKAVVQKRQRKLKRRIEKKKLRLTKNGTEESDSEEEKKVRKPLKESTTQKLPKAHSVTTTKKAAPNFSQAFQPDQIKLNKSNVEFLKELPFGKEYKEEKLPAIYIDQPKVKMHDNVCRKGKDVPRRLAPMLYQTNLSPEAERSPDRNAAKSLAFLIELQKKREEKLKDLEQMKRENRMRIEAIIRERKSNLKKDVCLGYYNIPVPEYEDVSEQLQKLKRKRSGHVGFVCESSDSDSEKTNASFKCAESRVSAELMAALRVGKKVSDSFKEWTLKKAPTLTCLRNYCNNKVSQISERLANIPAYNAKVMASRSTDDDMDSLRSRKERHEQLKKFWRAKQEYLNRRIEICNLLKEKISGSSISEDSSPRESITQGVHILDCIIADVLKSVKSSKSLSNHSALEETEVKRSCKSVCNMKNQVGGEAPKQTNDDLYKWLFDRKAMMIKKRDTNCFANTVRENLLSQNRKEFTKQDPGRGYHERLLKKHN